MTDQNILNQKALDNPQPGDYWHEMFCPYFIVVGVNESEITVLSCLGGNRSYNRKHELSAYIDNSDGTWSFDVKKELIVDPIWLKTAVCYSTIDGFVADVCRSKKTEAIVDEWRAYKEQVLRKKISEAQKAWEEFTGWAALKQPN